MKTDTQRVKGYTLVELMVAVFLAGIVLALTVAGFARSQHSTRIITKQSELEVDARQLVEQLRRDLWLTSRAEILLHPEGAGPYTAISFPVVAGADSLQLNSEGQIEWDATVVYHLWEGDEFQVRRTTFSPRDPSLSVAQRRDQLADVVMTGDGSGAYNSENAVTRPLINNLVEWELNIVGGRFDAYAPSGGRRRIPIGSARIEPGTREITFTTAGKNAGNTGAARHLGIDTLSATPSRLPLEGEWLLPAVHYSGATPHYENMQPQDETWSGNARLWFPSTSDGNSLTLQFENDQWVERNLYATAMNRQNLDRETITLPGSPSTFVLRLTGDREVWRASHQTMAPPTLEAVDSNMAVRVLLRGSDIGKDPSFEGGWINFNGTNVWATFEAAWGASVTIEQAFIAEALKPEDPDQAMDYVPGTRQDLLFGGYSIIVFTNRIESDYAPFLIDEDKSYLVGFMIHDTAGEKVVRAWTAGSGPHSGFIINDAPSDAVQQADWSNRNDVEAGATLYALRSLRAGHAWEGTYVSQIVDTRLDDPDYREFRWTATTPESSRLFMRVRAGDKPDLSDAPAWTNVVPASPGQTPFIQGRYAQVQAQFEVGTATVSGFDPNGYPIDPGTTFTPQLRDFTLSWHGEPRFVDLYLDASTGPNHGIYEVHIDGVPLLQGITVNATVYDDIVLGDGQTRRITASTFAEIVPRNTGAQQ